MVSPRVVAALALCLTLAACADYRTADLKRDVIPAEQIARDYRLDPDWWTATALRARLTLRARAVRISASRSASP